MVSKLSFSAGSSTYHESSLTELMCKALQLQTSSSKWQCGSGHSGKANELFVYMRLVFHELL